MHISIAVEKSLLFVQLPVRLKFHWWFSTTIFMLLWQWILAFL